MLLNLQFLRAIAAILVAYCHAHGLIVNRASSLNYQGAFWLEESSFIDIGALGVDIFFMISGFIIFYSTWNKKIEFKEFILRRIIRIYPIWSVAVCAMTIISLIPGTSASYSLQSIILSLLLIPHYNNNGDIFPILEIGWTLNYEVLFYLTFGIFLFLKRKISLIIITVTYTCLVILGTFVEIPFAIYSVLTNIKLLEFVIGGWLSWLFINNYKLNNLGSLLIFIILISTLYMFLFLEGIWLLNSFYTRGTIALCFMALFLLYPPLKYWNPAKYWIFIGNASYSIYLFHMFPIIILSGLWKRGWLLPPATVHPAFVWVFVIMTGIALGLFMYRFIERSMLDMMRKWVNS